MAIFSLIKEEEKDSTFSLIKDNESEVQKILKQKTIIDPELFKVKQTEYLDQGQRDVGVVLIGDEGRQTVINDRSKLTALTTPDRVPMGLSPEEADPFIKNITLKNQLLNQGYRLYDINTNEIDKTKPIEFKAPIASKNKYVNQWQSTVNGFVRGIKNYKTTSTLMKTEMGFDLESRVEEIAKLQAEIQGLKTSQVMDEFNQSKTFGEAMKKLGSNPVEIISQLTIESMAQFLPSYVEVGAVTMPTSVGVGAVSGGVPGAIAGLTYGAMSTAGLASFSMEYTGKLLEVLSEENIDITNPEELLQGLQDENIMEKARAKGIARGIPIAVFDMLSAGLAGQFVKKPAKSTLGKIGQGLAETGTQMSLGAGGEVAGALSAGEKIQPSAVIAEAFAEVGQAVPSGMINVAKSQLEAREISKVKDTKAYKSLQEARESGEYSEEALDMTEQFIRKNPNIDESTVLKFTGEALTVTKESLSKGGIHHYLVEESGAKDANDLLAREGLDPNKYDDTTPFNIKGQTKLETMVDGTTKVLISLSNKANKDTVIEEFYGNSYKTLSEQDKAVFDEYYNSQDTKMSRQEFFEKEGVKYFNNEGLYKETAIGKVFRKFKQYLQDIFGKANLPKDIRKFYDEAGLGGKVTEKKTSFQLSPQKYAKIKDLQRDLIKEGEPARFWYEKSGKALLDIVDGDKEKAKQLLSIIAITSPQMDVKSNFGQMIKGAYKYVQGQEPEAGRFPKAMAKKIKDVMQGKPYGGIKTNSFLDNLLAQIEKPKDKPVTVDMWMMRAFGFTKDSPTDLEYRQVRKAIQDLADEIGWEPHQVQASIWTSSIARWDQVYGKALEKAKKSGNYKIGKGFKSKKAELNFRNRVFKEFKKVSVDPKDIAKANYDYSDALNDFKGIVSKETISDVEFGNVSNIPYNELQEYDQEIRQILVDKNGKDKIAKLIGLLQAGKFNAPGFYEGQSAPAEHLEVLMSSTATSINPETKSLLELYGSIYGLLTKQWAVGVTKVFKATSKKRANVVHITTKADIQFDAIYQELLSKGYDTGAIPRQSGFNIVNFDNTVDNNKFFADVKEIINNIYENSSEDIIIKRSQSDGLLINNDWSKDKNGENYRQRISESDRSRDIGKFIDSTSNQINKVNEKYKKRWSERQVDPKRSFQLTPKQKEYFKDSKVRNEDGKLLTAFHGTQANFEEFKLTKVQSKNEHYGGDLGFWFTSEPTYYRALTEYDAENAEFMASDYALRGLGSSSDIKKVTGAKVIPAYLNIKNPLEIYGEDLYHSPLKEQIKSEIKRNYKLTVNTATEMRNALLSNGVDGIHIIQSDTDGNVFRDDWVAFKPEQIKSVYNKDPKSTGRSFSLEPTYFSTATRAVDKLSQSTQKQIKPQAVKGFLEKNQVTKQEMEFLNLEEYLSNYKPNERIPVEELAKFIKSNEVKITEIERKVHTFKSGVEKGYQVFVNDEGYKLKFDRDTELYELLDPDGQMLGEVDFEARFPFKDAQKIIDRQLGKTVPRIRHEQYQLDGEKEDYREITLSIPELEGPAFVREEHWEEPNVIASVRMNTRYINNSKVLFIEELQSDLHTSGQKVGYNVPMHRRKDDTMSPREVLIRPPDAPYKGFDWVSLALKRILRHGAENNFDEIAFINAEQVIDRWDLSKRVQYLAYDKRDVKGQPRLTVRGRDVNDKEFDLGVLKTPEELEKYLGKGVVDKMLRGEGTNPPHLNRKDRKKKETLLKGDDLKIKSRYMIDLYTNQIPQRLKKLTKKLGGRVGSASTVQIDPKQKQTYISITPKMKEKFIHSQRSFQLEEAKSNLEIPNETRLQYIQRGVQDKLNRLDQIQKKIGVDQDELDAYMKADLFTSKATDRIDKVDEFLVDSDDAFFKRLEDDGFSIDDLADYMYAKHAKERNKHIKDNINPENKNGSGMTNKDANAILKRFDKKIDGYAKEFRSEIIDKRLQILKDSGLISEDSYNLFTSGKIFKNYVPLKGTARGESIPMTGKGYNVTGKDIKGIKKGRTTKAENPVVQAIVDLNESIIRSEKNEVGKSLIKLIKEHPDITLENGEKLWETKGLKYLPRYDQNGEVEYMDPRKLRTNELMYWEDGKAKVVTINDPALHQGLANVGMGRGIPYLNGLNNYLRMINTTLNPEFMITNFQRDVQMAMLQLSTNESGKIAIKTAKSLPSAMRGIWAVLRGGERTEWSDAYDDFIEQGGKIGWIDQGTAEQKLEQLKKKIGTYNNKDEIRKSIRALGRVIDDYNSIIESGTRLSAYKNLVDSGVSKEKASQIAKNMTVNFNKKGQWGSLLNTLYLFFNASVQGGFNILKTLKTKKGLAFAGSLGVAGFLNSYINRAMDDDEWDEVNDYEKDTKWLFKIPGREGYIPIMLPYGYNTFVASGRIVEEMTFGDLQPYQAWGRMLNALENAFNPMGGGTPFQMVSPTATDLFVQIGEGKDWKGDPYRPQQQPYGKKKPSSELYYPSARKNSVEIARKLNEVTGGNQRVEGAISVSPETMDLVWDFSTGGMGRFIANSIETGTLLSQGKTPDIKNIPIARKFYVKKSEFKSKSIAYDLLDMSETKKLSDKQISVFKRRVDLANKAGSLSDEKKEDMLKEMEKNQKFLNAPKVERDTVYKIEKMYKRLKRNDLSQQEMDELWELVEDSYYDEYITKRKKKNIQKMIQEKEK